MTSFTIELPDELAARLARLAPEQRNAFAVAALAEAIEETLPTDDADFEASCAALEEAFQDADVGRTYSFEEVMARYAHIGTASTDRTSA